MASINGFQKIISPIMAAAMAKIKTAAAAASFAFPANSLYSGETKSTRYSKAVFIASAAKTIAIAIMHNSHSVFEILKKKPPTVTNIIKKAWIRAFICD